MNGKSIIVQLSEKEFASLRSAASHKLGDLGLAEMDDPALRRLIRRMTRIAEKTWGVKYRTKF